MKLLNAGCGGCRPQDPFWYNSDTLREQLAIGTPERTNLDAEPRYVQWNMVSEPAPFPDETFDGILLQHVIEHLTCHESVAVLEKCRNMLKPGGMIIVSVPDAEYFLKVYDKDTKENSIELFGEPIHDEGFNRFFDYGLFRYDHKQILTKDSLTCIMLKAGFCIYIDKTSPSDWIKFVSHPACCEMYYIITRRKFSTILSGLK